MSDDVPASAHPGCLSPRDIDTRRYRVLKEIPLAIAVGDTFSAWPQGEVFANVNGLLSVTRISDIEEWEAQKLVERV